MLRRLHAGGVGGSAAITAQRLHVQPAAAPARWGVGHQRLSVSGFRVLPATCGGCASEGWSSQAVRPAAASNLYRL